MNKSKWLYNPFEYIAGWKAFGIGSAILLLTTVIGYWGHTVFYALEVKAGSNISLGKAFSLQALGLAVTVVLTYLIAFCFARRTRFQDMLGTITLAKYPLLLISILSWILGDKIISINAEEIINNRLLLSDYIYLFVFAIFSILVLTWEIALLYNAFRVSSNLKKSKCVILFILAMLISEITTILLVAAIY